MSNVTSTSIHIVSTDAFYTIPGDFSTAQVQQMYAASIDGLQSMQGTETVDAATGVRTITFRPRTGTKG